MRENENKIKTFWDWKSSRNKKIEAYQNFTGSYIKTKSLYQPITVSYDFEPWLKQQVKDQN